VPREEFGGVIAANRPVSAAMARQVAEERVRRLPGAR
jgi:AICAR transformylase/IMP cyclohydrolase PurH